MDMIVGRKTLRKLESNINHTSASKPSSFAVKLMEKMGWKEGEGLGKNNDGISKHIVISKREDNTGLGSDTAIAQKETVQDHWWLNSYSQNLQKFKIVVDKKDKKSKKDKKEKKNKKDKKEKSDNEDENDSSKTKSKKRKIEEISEEPILPSYDEMFKATGGARLGMRARREQKGKILRTEGNNLS